MTDHYTRVVTNKVQAHEAAALAYVVTPTISEIETWSPIEGWEGLYSVSSLGRVRSEDRISHKSNGKIQTVHSRILAPGNHGGSYQHVALCRDGKAKCFFIHRVVLEAFVGVRPIGMEARHLNGDPRDNRLDNREWGTPVENAADRFAHGNQVRGQSVGTSKITEEIVLKIRNDARSQDAIASDFGISQTMVSKIKLRKSWGWLL